jgi:hypothetical protein
MLENIKYTHLNPLSLSHKNPMAQRGLISAHVFLPSVGGMSGSERGRGCVSLVVKSKNMKRKIIPSNLD